jgi:hypothetical protein
MEEFYRFYVEKTEFDNKTLIAKFYYSFDKKTQFVEKVDFSSNFLSCREDFDNNIFSNFLFPLSIAL